MLTLRFFSPLLLLAAVCLNHTALAAETQPAPQIAVTVRDLATGKPVAGAKVKIFGCYRKDIVSQTDAEGIALLPKPTESVGIGAVAPGMSPVAMYVDPPQNPIPDKLEFALEPATTIGGRVVDENEKPIAGATVVLHARKKYPNSEQRLDVSYVDIKTDSDGKWSYTGVPASFDSIEVGTWHHQYLNEHAFFPMNEFKDMAALHNNTAKLTLESGTPLTLTILNPEGKPAVDARVGHGQDRVASNIVPESKADAEGKVHIGIKAGTNAILTIFAKGCAPAQRRVTIGKEPQELTVQLDKAVTLTGQVVDFEGKPIAGARIFLDTWHGSRPLDKGINADKEGKFSWDQAPVDEVFVDVMKQGYADNRNVGITAGKANIVTLMPPTTFKATVVDAETGQPVASYQVIKGIQWDNSRQISWDRREREAKKEKDGSFAVTLTFPYPIQILRVEAEGYLPADSDQIRMDGKAHTFAYKLVKASTTTGTVLNAEGKPVANAQVALATLGNGIQIENGRIPEWSARDTRILKTDSAGQFKLTSQKDKYGLVILAEDGYAMIRQDEFEKNATITLTHWAQVKGVAKIGSKPAVNQEIVITPKSSRDYEHDALGRIWMRNTAKTDKEGRFTMDRVLAEKISVARNVRISDRSSQYAYSVDRTPKPGETVEVQVGGTGRPVVGRVEIPESVRKAGFLVNAAELGTAVKNVEFPIPEEVKKLSDSEKQEWYKKFIASEEGKAFLAARQAAYEKQHRYPVVLDSSTGQFRVDDVAPGEYILHLSLAAPPADGNTCGTGDEIAMATATLTMPEIPGGVSDEPLEMASIPMQEIKNVNVGAAAPEIITKTLDGKAWKLSDQKGKYVLLDFWATWCGPCVAELPHLKEAWEAFGKDPNFVMASLSLDQDVKEPTEFTKEKQIGWTQLFLGNWTEDKVTKEYNIKGIPSIWLIGPDGKVIAKGLRGEQVKSAIESALKNRTSP